MLIIRLVKEHAVRFHWLTTYWTFWYKIRTITDFKKLRGFQENFWALFFFIGTMHKSDVTMHLNQMRSKSIGFWPFFVLNRSGYQNFWISYDRGIKVINILSYVISFHIVRRFLTIFLELQDTIMTWVRFAFVYQFDKIVMPLPN